MDAQQALLRRHDYECLHIHHPSVSLALLRHDVHEEAVDIELTMIAAWFSFGVELDPHGLIEFFALLFDQERGVLS